MNSNIPFQLVETHGTAYESGRQYGSQCQDKIGQVIDFYRWIFELKSKLSWDQSLEKAAEFIHFLDAYDSDIMETIRGIADGSQRPLLEIVALNVRTELLFLLADGKTHPKGSCTALATVPPASGHTLLAQNWDWYPQVRECCVILDQKPSGRPRILQAVEAGIIAKAGFNMAGIGLCTNALVTAEWRVGVPYHAILWRILKAESMSEAIGAVTGAARASAANYLIAHKDGEAVNLEAAPQDVNYIFPDQGIISHANHCQVVNAKIKDLTPAIWPDTIMRDYRTAKMLKAASGPINQTTIQEVLKDHFDRPNSICTHPDLRFPPQEQGQTNLSMIIDLTEQTCLVAKGPPCEHAYVSLS